MSKSLKDVDVVLSSVSKLASYNMVLQLSFRILTFLLNAFILRYVTKETLGIVNVRLTLLYSTILFMSREAFRRACLSTDTNNAETKDNDDNKEKISWVQTINLLWCMIPVGIIFTFLGVYVWSELLENPDPLEIPNYHLAVIVFGLCALAELIVEPLWVVSQAYLFVKLKVISEALAILVKSITTVALVVHYPEWGLISFCVSTVLFSATYISIYYGYFVWFITTGRTKKMDDFPLKSIRDMFPSFKQEKPLINTHSALLTFSFLKQSVLKQILTEGERYVMTVLNVLSFADQGVYDVINNLGSLVARFVFLPIEESFYLFFAKTLKRGETANKQPADQIKAISDVLFCLLRLVVLIGLVILAFGLPFSRLLLDIYGGGLLSGGSGPLLLKVYCLYVLVIAINGTTECFVFAAMSQNDVDRYNKKMFLFSFLFLTSSYYLTTVIGSVGFILANCLNMIARIIHSLYFITKFYSNVSMRSPLLGLVPNKLVLIALLLSCLVCCYSESIFCCNHGWLLKFVHIGIGAFCFALVGTMVWLKETELIQFLLSKFRKTDKLN